MVKIAVVGSGISALLSVSNILKRLKNVRVDVFEAKDFSYGLLTSGVSPLSAEFKLLRRKFDSILLDKRVQLFHNHVFCTELASQYQYVIYASGGKERRADYLTYGENSVFSAGDVAAWYNGRLHLPAMEQLPQGHLRAVIIGYGNVALDLLDFLVAPYSHLIHTSFAPQALEFKKSRTFEVYIIGRKNIDHSAFSTAEFKKSLSGKQFDITDDNSTTSEKFKFARAHAVNNANCIHLISNALAYRIDASLKTVHLAERALPFDLLITSFGFDRTAAEHTRSVGWAKSGRGTIAISTIEAKRICEDMSDIGAERALPGPSDKEPWIFQSMCERTCGALGAKQSQALNGSEIDRYLLKTGI